MILVQLPEDPRKIDAVLPRSRSVTIEDLPLVTRVTDAIDAAHDTAHRLRQAGARVVIVEEPVDRDGSAFCTDHPAQLAARQCERCSAAICAGCMVNARGEPRCVRCQTEIVSQNTRTRRRQLFLLLIFSAFLYKVWDHFRLDAERMESSAPITIGVIQFAPKADTVPTSSETSTTAATNLAKVVRARSCAMAQRGVQPILRQPDERFGVDIRGPFAVDVNAPTLAETGDSGSREWFALYGIRAISSSSRLISVDADITRSRSM